MKFVPIAEENIPDNILKTQYESSRKIGRIAVGETTLFIKKIMKVHYISFSNIHRVFRRIKAVPARIGREKGEIRLEYLVLCSKTAELCEIALPDVSASTAIIEELQHKNPAIKIGKKE